MRKINLIAVLISLLFYMNLNAGTMCQTITPNADSDKYSVELIPSDKENIVLVKFTLPEDCYVNIKVTDNGGNTVQELVSDEMPAGTYNIYHKCAGKIISGNDKCIMEIYKSRDNVSMKIYKKEIVISAK